MPTVDAIRSESRSIIEAVKSQAVGMSVLDIARRFLLPLILDLMNLAQDAGGSGTEKKAAVMAMVGDFYDEVILPLDLPGPDVLIDPLLRQTLLAVTDYAIDGLLHVRPSAVAALRD